MAIGEGLTMCNLYSSTTAKEAMRQLFDVPIRNDHLGNAEPLPAIWPKYDAPVVRLAEDGARELVMMKWGFLTAQTSKKTGKPISPAAWNNARDDKVATNGLWKDSFANRRCLVPASSFCEAKGRNPAIYHWFALKGDEPRPPFAFAGMWRGIQNGLPNEVAHQMTHTIITTDANELVKPIHPTRMPVILRPADYEEWLNGSTDQALALLRPFPAGDMQIVRYGEGDRADKPA